MSVVGFFVACAVLLVFFAVVLVAAVAAVLVEVARDSIVEDR